jgi:benzoylformate decarboxylase
VINNREYNVLKTFMRSQPHSLSAQTGRFIGMDLTKPPIDFGALATAMGLPAKRLGRADEIADTVTEAIASCRPNLIEIAVGVE